MILRTIISIFTMFIALAALLPVLVLILPVWTFIGMCMVVERLIIKPGTSWQNILKFDQSIGWRPEPNLNKGHYYDQSGDKGSIITDKEGWPGKNTIEESDIIVFGDSFAYGFGAEFDKTYYRLRRDLKIKPIAAPGYNMVQPLILMKNYAEKLKGKSVMWFICLENDLADNIRMYQSRSYMVPFLRIHNNKWEAVTTHIQPDKWLYSERKSHNSLRYATICTESPYSARIFSACEFLIQEAAELCNSVDAELLAFTIPDKRQLADNGRELKNRLKNPADFDNDFPDRRIKEICEKHQVNFIAGKEILDINDYKARDPHWNSSGNRKISDFIYKHFDNLL